MPSLMNKYIETIKENLDAPDVFVEASAYHLVSTCLGRFFHCSIIPGGRLGARPNIWILLSSIPGRTRRSTITEYAQYIYRETLMKFNIARFAMKEEEAFQKVFNTIIEEGTPEGIVDHIQITKLKHYCIVSTEFGSVLQRMGTKDYELGVSTLYSKLYYGEAHSMVLSQRGKEAVNRYLPPNIYCNMFAGMQEAVEYITRTMSRQGLLRRLILTYVAPDEIKRWIPPVNLYRENIYDKLWKISESLFSEMINTIEELSRYSITSFDIAFHPKALDIVNNYAEDNDKRLTEPEGLTDANIYMQSFWEHLAKLSMLEAIADKSFNKDFYPPRGWITVAHVNKALEFLNEATKHNREIISNLGREEEKIMSSTTPLERIFAIIESGGKKGVPRSLVYRKSKMTTPRLQIVFDTLIAQERIRQETRSSGGTHTTWFVTT